MTVPAGLLMGTLALTACSGVKTSQPSYYNPETSGLPPGQTGEGASLFTFGKGGSVSGGGGGASQIQVNAYLWRATLNTLAFMPLVSADPFGGVIITDWYTPPASPGERFKVNAYIMSRQLTADAVQVSVFHQVNQGGQWVDSPADPSVASGLEDRILAQAADLQAADKNSK
ncbi:DUF3576 domain-containing protein [Acidocella aromatica]|uniref:DUF3576 domain-containing protein n=1 Tax=Acidocella aromatica TaxID=1303579 RepID=A0A840VL41_9PROT|nr:DUF3576 domain-containing protein [Acidocella aromatica]MBB5373875.1 hypothetical protein [Acidocella aromatica]